MQHSQILWIDLRDSTDEPCIADCLATTYKTEIVSGATEIEEAVCFHQPQVLCFDYDFPDQTDLGALQRSKTRHPELPVIMLTKDDSAELAIWALRSRAWNYFVKPVVSDKVMDSIAVLLQRASRHAAIQRNNLMPQPVIPTGSGTPGARGHSGSTVSAACYVKQHLDRKITLDQAAHLCGMSKYHFSRTFKSDHKITFQEYVIQQRVSKAVDLLKNSDLLVTQIALAVGFEDLSYFSKTFQKHIGMLPSCYRKALLPQRSRELV
jgi:YesN/AraC family two-component response regulator